MPATFRRALGTHVLLELYGVDASILDNEFRIKCDIELAAKAAGATVLSSDSYSFKPQGVTAFALLSESHISVHTWPEYKQACVDIFTCGESNPHVAVDFLIRAWEPAHYVAQTIERPVYMGQDQPMEMSL